MGRVREEKARRKKIGEEKARRKKIKEETVRRKKIQVREKVGKSRNTVFFHWFVALEGRKVGSLKPAGAEPSDRMRDQRVHAAATGSAFWKT